MTPIVQRPDVFAPWLSSLVVVGTAMVAVAVWVGAHGLRGLVRAHAGQPASGTRGALWAAVYRWVGRAWLLVQAAVGTVALWLAMQAMGRFVLLTTPWPLWWPALLGAVTVEGVLALYGAERRKVSPGMGWALTALRVGIVLLLAFVLTQPVLRRQKDDKRIRVIAVLLDESTSMDLVDGQLPASEKMQLARLFGINLDIEPLNLSGSADALTTAGGPLIAEADRLRVLAATGAADAAVAQHVTRRWEPLREAVAQAKQAVDEARSVLARTRRGRFKIAPDLRDDLADADETLRRIAGSLTQMASRFRSGAEWLHSGLAPFRRDMQAVQDGLIASAARLKELSPQVDRAFTASLPAEMKRKIGRAADLTRRVIARKVLGGKDGLLEALADKYVLRVYRFARTPVEVSRDRWERGVASGSSGQSKQPGRDEEPSEEALWRGATDLQSVLAKARRDISADRLAGVLLVTDGRHNTAGGVEELGRQFASQEVPVCSVLVGSEIPPIDAAVTSVRVPTTVFLGDRARFQVVLRMDALIGKEVKVRLVLDDKVLDEKSVRVPQEHHREEVRFSHKPDKVGVHRYRIEVGESKGETVLANNRFPVDISVSDDRTKILIVEGRPRWEFRYLRNLFSGRDRSVFLQFVLLKPDRLAGAPPGEKIHASVDREFGDSQASALPASPAEWLKFDVIILGDVSPEALPPEMIETLRGFVAQRGGSLVVLSGQEFMPHAYTSQTLQEMLPLTYAYSAEPVVEPPEPAYRIRLTTAGRVHPIMQQKDDLAANLRVWNALPRLHSRHPVTGAKEGAAVLAYAEPVPLADEGIPDTPDAPLLKPGRATPASGREGERNNALIAEHRFGSGRVIMLAFDHTWRMRYRVGDARHHRFWGQLLRWANDDRLRTGTKRVRLGTDRLVYNPDQPLVVRAKLLDRERNPVTKGEVIANVYRPLDPEDPGGEEELAATRAMTYVKNSNGYYEADMGRFSKGGRYRVELSGAAVLKELAVPDVPRDTTVETEILVVVPVAGEMRELTADRTIPARLAAVSGGVVVSPLAADKVLPYFGRGSGEFRERRDTSLWDSWPVLALILLAGSAEWIIRKREGLT